MSKMSLRIILIALFLLLFGGSFFAVLAVEEDRRLAKSKAEQAQYEALLKSQSSLIEQNQKQTTTIKQPVPVTSSSNVGSIHTVKPKSTRTTKTS